MLFDLRERIRVQSRLPRLPAGWHARWRCGRRRPVLLRRLRGGHPHRGRPVLEAVLTDVSARHGRRLAPLLLSGAFGGLLAAAAARLPRRGQRLPAAAELG